MKERGLSKEALAAMECADESDEEDLPDTEFERGFKCPGKLWKKLYRYVQFGAVVTRYNLHLAKSLSIFWSFLNFANCFLTVYTRI